MKQAVVPLIFLAAFYWSSNTAFTQEAGNALEFDGIDDHVAINTDIIINEATGFTVEFWLKPTATPDRMTAIRLKGSTEFALSLGRIGNLSLLGRSVHFGFRGNTGVGTSNSAYFLDNLQSQWHHFAFIYTGGDKSSISSYDFYGDGVLGVLAGVNTIGGSDNANEVGRDAPATASGFVTGFIDEIRVWNGVRSELEIRENMGKSLVPANEANLVAYWKFDGSSVTNVTDSKGSNDGTISGATRVTSTAPLGDNSAFVATQSQADVGPSGGQIQVTITSVPDDSNNLGVYQFGSLSGDPVTAGETFPLGIDKRSDTVWGIVERGTVTASLVFSYNSIAGVDNPSTVQILKRDNAEDTSWELITPSARDDSARTVTFLDQTEFSEFALGGSTDNPLPIELSLFSATNTVDGVLISWRTESEYQNLGFNLYRREMNHSTDRTIAWVEGAGSTPVVHHYQFVDKDAQSGRIYYYYLQDVDIQGVGTKSQEIAVYVRPRQPGQTKALPQQFRLLQNFPNPFNPETWVPYELPSASDVQIAIFDSRGRIVRTLTVGVQRAGYYVGTDGAAHWDGRSDDGESVPSGVYFYHFRAGDYHATKKMLILK